VAFPRRYGRTPLPRSRHFVNRSLAKTAPNLQALDDRVAIAELLHDYCRGLDAMDLDCIPALVTEDCVVSYGPRLESRGAWRPDSHNARPSPTIGAVRSGRQQNRPPIMLTCVRSRGRFDAVGRPA
jgi:hypothetical protein